MVSGESGDQVVSAPQAVEEDLKLLPGSVTLQLQLMGGTLAREDAGILERKIPATTKNVG